MLCVTAAQRAGTTALEGALGSSGYFHNFREIFHTSEIDAPGNFFGYSRTLQLPFEITREPADVTAIIHRYFDHLSAISRGKTPLIDVKLNSWNALRHAWAYPFEEPLTLAALKSRDATIVFIQRRDLTGQVLSEFIARQANVWHDLTNRELPPPFSVDLRAATVNASNIIRMERLIWSFISTYQHALCVTYEDLFEGGMISDRIAAPLQDRFSAAHLKTYMTIPIQRNDGNKAELVVNYEEIDLAIKRLSKDLGRLSLD